MQVYVAVVGAGQVRGEESLTDDAEEIGRLLGLAGAVVVTGGLGGVMEAACRGARSSGGTTLGILPGNHRGDANPWVQWAVATGLGEMRNALVVSAADAVIAVGGEYGTLSEVGFALKLGRPVVGLRTWSLSRPGGHLDPGVLVAADPPGAVSMALAAGQG
ncbi:MAG: TIGR00725 family protein [Acidimicrobiales bacterium]